MKVALVVNRVTKDTHTNLLSIMDNTHKAADRGVDLILYPEAALTGLINNDDPDHDLLLGEPIPGPLTNTLSKVARERSIYISMGIIEREKSKLYDSAVLIDSKGEIVLKYRRIDPHWHGERADPEVYRQGKELRKAKTTLGEFSYLICGDLFDDGLINRLRRLRPEWLLFPFARCFEDGSYDQKRWDTEEKPEYINRVEQAGVTTFMVNYIADKENAGGSFGGAMVVSSTGEIIEEFPIGIEGILYVDL